MSDSEITMNKRSAVFLGFDHSGRAPVRIKSPPFSPWGRGIGFDKVAAGWEKRYESCGLWALPERKACGVGVALNPPLSRTPVDCIGRQA